MNRNISQFTAIFTLTLAFAILNFTDKIMSNADEKNLKASVTNQETVSTEIYTSQTTTAFSETTVQITETPQITTIIETTEETEIPETELYNKSSKELGEYSSDFSPLTSNELSELYTEGFVIVGDSIASGYKVYNRLPERQVMAVGSLGARNMHDFKVTLNNTEYDVADAIRILQPRYICMSMGMNDLNIGTMDDYIQNYTNNIDEFHENSPHSAFIVMAITPIASGITHSTNDKIDTYNEALKKMVEERDDINIYYVNAGQVLKNEWNCLSPTYSGGDGIHLAPNSYDAMLTYLLESLSEIDDSYMIKTKTPEVTTVPSWSEEETAETAEAENIIY